jgi:dihydrodipicolinate synthase/N-acetylneuraminate lyase
MAVISRRGLLQAGFAGILTASAIPAMAKRQGAAETSPPAVGVPPKLRFTVPVPTPFTADLELDLKTHRQLLTFYRQAGATAVLAVASTGEMLSITWPEALLLTGQASSIFGSSGTWASLSRGTSVAACRSGIRQLKAAGAGTAIVVPGVLADAELSDSEAMRRLLDVAQGAALPLGLYEAIAPFHRVLQPEQVQLLAATGGYRLLKTTQASSAVVAAITARVPAGFAIYEANTADLFAVLEAGAAGITDFCAAAFPELLRYLCQRWGNVDEQAKLQRVCAWIASADAALLSELPFPLSVKVVLQRRGLPIMPLSRQAVTAFNGEQQQRAAELVRQFDGLRNDLGIPSLL